MRGISHQSRIARAYIEEITREDILTWISMLTSYSSFGPQPGSAEILHAEIDICTDCIIYCIYST
jgi:hypothetical protein